MVICRFAAHFTETGVSGISERIFILTAIKVAITVIENICTAPAAPFTGVNAVM